MKYNILAAWQHKSGTWLAGVSERFLHLRLSNISI